jgi:hypothetical protein
MNEVDTDGNVIHTIWDVKVLFYWSDGRVENITEDIADDSDLAFELTDRVSSYEDLRNEDQELYDTEYGNWFDEKEVV